MRVVLAKDLGPLRLEADASIRRQAEVERLKFVTQGSGKAMAYQQKAVEAERFVSTPNPVLSEYPHVVREAGALGLTPEAMAFLILYLRGEWQVASAAIEEIERIALVALAAAQNPAQITAAAVVDWTGVSEATAAYHAAA